MGARRTGPRTRGARAGEPPPAARRRPGRAGARRTPPAAGRRARPAAGRRPSGGDRHGRGAPRPSGPTGARPSPPAPARRPPDRAARRRLARSLRRRPAVRGRRHHAGDLGPERGRGPGSRLPCVRAVRDPAHAPDPLPALLLPEVRDGADRRRLRPDHARVVRDDRRPRRHPGRPRPGGPRCAESVVRAPLHARARGSRVTRARRGGPRRDRRGGALRGHGTLRATADPARLVWGRAARAPPQLPRPGGPRAPPAGCRREPLLPAGAPRVPLPAGRARHRGDGDRLAGPDLGRLLGANVVKVERGGWVPLAIAAAVFLGMTTWNRGTALLRGVLAQAAVPLDRFLTQVERARPPRVPGTAVFLTPPMEGAPPLLVLHLSHNQALHEAVILLSIIVEDEPDVTDDRRLVVERLPLGFTRARAHYGFMETPDIPDVVARCGGLGVAADPERTTNYLG